MLPHNVLINFVWVGAMKTEMELLKGMVSFVDRAGGEPQFGNHGQAHMKTDRPANFRASQKSMMHMLQLFAAPEAQEDCFPEQR